MMKLKVASANAKSISELITLVNQIANDASKSVSADLQRIQYSAPELMKLAKLDPLVPGVNTPVNWTEFPGLSEKVVQLAKHQHRPAPLTRLDGKKDVKSVDAPMPVKHDDKQNRPQKH